MYILAVIILLFANYLMYLNSGKLIHVPFQWEERLKPKKAVLKAGAVTLFVLSGIIFIASAGILGGFIYGLFSYILIASCTLLVRPLVTPEKAKR